MDNNDKRPTIGIVGCFQNGKSTLVNCLLDDWVAPTGDGRAKTRKPALYTWGQFRQALSVTSEEQSHPVVFRDFLEGVQNQDSDIERYLIGLWKPLLCDADIIDTPGFNDCEEDNRVAMECVEGLDFAVFLARNKPLTEIELGLLAEIARRKIQFCILLNCKDSSRGLWDPNSEVNSAICRQIESSVRSLGHRPYPVLGRYVWPVNLAWFWYAAKRMPASEAEQDLFESVEHYSERVLHLGRSAIGNLVEKSNFLPFRSVITSVAAHWAQERSYNGNIARQLIQLSRGQVGVDPKAAMLFAERACFYAPKYIPALERKAESCLVGGYYHDVVHASARIIGIDGRNIGALFLRARALFKLAEDQGDWEKKQVSLSGARDDAIAILELCHDQWRHTWDIKEDVTAQNYAEAVFLKADCEQRLSMNGHACQTMRELCDHQSVQPHLPQDLFAVAWIVIASLGDSFAVRIEALSRASTCLDGWSKLDDQAKERFRAQLKRFGLESRMPASSAIGSNAAAQLQRWIWKACKEEASGDVDRAVYLFVKHDNFTSLFRSTWSDDPLFALAFIDTTERLNVTLLKQYLELTGNGDHSATRRMMGYAKLSAEQQHEVDAILVPRFEFSTDTTFGSNSAQVKNVSTFYCEDIHVDINYKIDGAARTTKLSYGRRLCAGESHEWSDVFSGKGFFGTNLSDLVITRFTATQGVVDWVNA